MSLAHTSKDVATVIATCDVVIGMLRTVVEKKQLKQMLQGIPLQPLFKVN